MLPVYSTTNIAGGPRVSLCANYLAYRRRDRVGRCAEPSCWSFRDAHERASKRGNDTQVQNGCLCAHARAGLMCAFMLQLPVRELLGFFFAAPSAGHHWLLAAGRRLLAAGLLGSRTWVQAALPSAFQRPPNTYAAADAAVAAAAADAGANADTVSRHKKTHLH